MMPDNAIFSRTIFLFISLVCTLSISLIACDSSSSSSLGANDNDSSGYNITVMVSNLSGSNLVLQNNAGDNLSINSNGNFSFPTQLADNADYNVTVLSQPEAPFQYCSVTNGSGTVSGADVTDVIVDCRSNLTACSSGAVQYNHLYSSDIAGLTQHITVTGTIPFICDASYNISGSSTATIAVSGQLTSADETCSWTATADMAVTIDGVLAGALLTVNFDETWYIGSPFGSGLCIDASDGSSSAFIYPHIETQIVHSIDFPAINGYSLESPAMGPGASGSYIWSISLI
ncbi:MAG: hypothetical protein OEY11_12905 [Gammaproteobacteria bacterium]|nr:hypothetical protein [Gammaproteobacteria bacterium]